jgi:hypothetical protein
MEGREDPAVHPEVGMPHVRPFDRVFHAQRNPPEIVGSHHIVPAKNTRPPAPPPPEKWGQTQV